MAKLEVSNSLVDNSSTIVIIHDENDNDNGEENDQNTRVELLIYDISKGMSSMFSQFFTGKRFQGETRHSVEDFDNFIREVAPIRYKIDQYKFFENNCNNFTNECANFLIGKGIPEDIMNLPEEFFETKGGKRFKYVMNTVDDSSPRCEGMGLILLFMNIIFPGFGTVLAGMITLENHKRSSTVMIGIIQMVLSVIVIGWIWSIWWGFKIWKESD